MKEQNYKKHIQGLPLDKIQEGSFEYSRANSGSTLSEYAKKLRESLTPVSTSSVIITGRDKL